MSSRSAPALLTDCTWHGTLAAARDLGGHGVPVTLACDSNIAAARWSRFVTRTVSCPPSRDGDRFADWLREFARRDPGHVYQPTSDDAAWIAAVYRDTLAEGLQMDVPPVSALAAVLDKNELAKRALAAGLSVPRSWAPADEGEVQRVANSLPYPVVVKPRMHVLASGWTRTRRAREAAELLPAWRDVRASSRTTSLVRDHVPLAEVPLIQEVYGAADRIYTVDGFIDSGGEAFVALACTKILQCPRGSGPGVLFEPAPLDPSIAKGLRSLLQGAGFQGIFDAEFVSDGGRSLLIDLNPRFYNHMAYEVDRGMPLAWMGYLAALGHHDAVRDEVQRAGRVQSGHRVYAFRMRVRLMLMLQALAGTMKAEERRRWREWLERHAHATTDPVAAPGDMLPAVAEFLHQAWRAARHPREFLRSHVQGRSS